MTRLFLRFYVGVLVILVAAWLGQSWLYGSRFEPINAQVIRDAYFGGMRIARQKYLLGQELGKEEELFQEIRAEYDFPVRRHTAAAGWDFGDLHLCRGIDHDLGDGTYIMSRIRAGEAPILLFGPLPEFAGPTNLEVVAGMGAVLLTTALAIALLLRPVMRQFQAVERAAARIASGELTTRIDTGRGVAGSKLVLAFNEMAARTEKMVQSQRELLQAVSHELRTPLSRIQFATEMIRTSGANVPEERLQSLESAADDLDVLVGELLTYVRMGANPEQGRDDVRISEVLEDVVRNNSPLFPDVHFGICDEQNAEDLVLSADPAGFRRAMHNLLSNAARFSKDHVRVNTQQINGSVIIDVDDDGPGIPEEDRVRVFHPFVRLSGSGTGVGLGLAIVSRIVSQHGGTISVDECPLGGCRIRTIWPVG